MGKPVYFVILVCMIFIFWHYSYSLRLYQNTYDIFKS